MTGRKHVLLLIEASSAYARGCLCGVARYANHHTQWVLHHVPRAGTDADELALLASVKADGIIARIETARISQALRARNVPTIAIASSAPVPDFPTIGTDEHRVIELGVEHLLGNGFSELAYCGVPGRVYSDLRESAFRAMPTPPQINKHVYHPPRLRSEDEDPLVPLAKWLSSLPKPVGVLACHDTRAREIVQACNLADIRVPEEVAVVGGRQ